MQILLQIQVQINILHLAILLVYRMEYNNKCHYRRRMFEMTGNYICKK